MNKEGQEGYKYHGPGSDSVLDAKPGVQTGPAAGDSGAASQAGAGTADTVVCKDGSNAAKSSKCKQHGGIDKAATRAAMNARGHMQGADSSATPADTGARSGTDTGQANRVRAPGAINTTARPVTRRSKPSRAPRPAPIPALPAGRTAVRGSRRRARK